MIKTRRYEKFDKARAMIVISPVLQAKLRGWQRMKAPTLYRRLDEIGAVWDTMQKKWIGVGEARGSVLEKAKEARENHAVDATVQVRIIAHWRILDVVVDEQCELYRAMDYEVDFRSARYPNRDGLTYRVYLKLKRTPA